MSTRVRSAKPVMLAALLAMIAVVAAVGSPSTASAGDSLHSGPSSASDSIAPVRGAIPEVDERQCNVGERPRQIVLNLGIGGEEGQRCFGGTPGWMYIGNAPVYSVFTGDYKGAIECHNRIHHFGPNALIYPIDICTHVMILPPDCRLGAAAVEDCRVSATRSLD